MYAGVLRARTNPSLQKLHSNLSRRSHIKSEQVFSIDCASLQICELCHVELPKVRTDIDLHDKTDYIVYLECGKIHAHALCFSDLIGGGSCPFCCTEAHEQVLCGNSIKITSLKS